MDCQICLNNIDSEIIKTKCCQQLICTECNSKLGRCAFCRSIFSIEKDIETMNSLNIHFYENHSNIEEDLGTYVLDIEDEYLTTCIYHLSLIMFGVVTMNNIRYIRHAHNVPQISLKIINFENLEYILNQDEIPNTPLDLIDNCIILDASKLTYKKEIDIIDEKIKKLFLVEQRDREKLELEQEKNIEQFKNNFFKVMKGD